MLRFIASTTLFLSSSAAWAEDYDWHNEANRVQMTTIFEATAKTCSAMFGFTRIPSQPRAEMADKIDAYLLLRDDPDEVLEKWVAVFKPAIDLASNTEDAQTKEDAERGGAALVAAAEDPSVMAEAEEQYVSGALGPFRRALQACSEGAADPFLGK
jgi:hypothetical protein